MSNRLITLLAALVVLGFAVAACGDDESDSAGSGDTRAGKTVTNASDASPDTDAAAREQTQTAEEQTRTAEGGGAAAPAGSARTKANCVKTINSARELSADVKAKLTGLCDKATSKDPDDVGEAAREFCETMVSSRLPEGKPGRDQALATCEERGRLARQRASQARP